MTKQKKLCRDCKSPDLVPRGPKGYRNQCHACWAATQRRRWAENREACLLRSRASYRKHAEKRKEESSRYQKENPEYRALAEWFRKKGIPVGSLDKKEISALIAMKKAVKQAKRHEQ